MWKQRVGSLPVQKGVNQAMVGVGFDMAKVIKGNFPGSRQGEHPREPGRKPGPDYHLHLGVAFSDPVIWRRVIVSSDLTLAQLHQVIQVCMGWRDCCAHRFLVGKIFYYSGAEEYDEAAVSLRQLEHGMTFVFTYLYDGGQGWEVQISLEEVVMPPVSAGCPALLGGERGCPPEDVGDIHHYQALLSALSTASGDLPAVQLAVPGYPAFHVDQCDQSAINERLREFFNTASGASLFIDQ